MNKEGKGFRDRSKNKISSEDETKKRLSKETLDDQKEDPELTRVWK